MKYKNKGFFYILYIHTQPSIVHPFQSVFNLYLSPIFNKRFVNSRKTPEKNKCSYCTLHFILAGNILHICTEYLACTEPWIWASTLSICMGVKGSLKHVYVSLKTPFYTLRNRGNIQPWPIVIMFKNHTKPPQKNQTITESKHIPSHFT